MTETEKDIEKKLHHRFGRIERLIGEEKLKRLYDARVMIIGLGGVGSWAAESIVRSGVGHVTLIDFDEVCITNSNRQLQAMEEVVGHPKAEVLAERLKKINPLATITSHVKFYSAENSDEILSEKPDFVVDAIDNVTAKCHLLHTCRSRNLPIVCSTGAGGRLDPTQIQVKDLGETERDPLAKAVRKILRQQYGYPEQGKFGIPAVFSWEEPHPLRPEHKNNAPKKINGTVSFVTASFGMVCASVVVRSLIGEL